MSLIFFEQYDILEFSLNQTINYWSYYEEDIITIIATVKVGSI